MSYYTNSTEPTKSPRHRKPFQIVPDRFGNHHYSPRHARTNDSPATVTTIDETWGVIEEFGIAGLQ